MLTKVYNLIEKDSDRKQQREAQYAVFDAKPWEALRSADILPQVPGFVRLC